MNPTPGKFHFKPLTSLRFFAAMHVLVFHNHLDQLTGAQGAIRNIIRTGYVGVSLFFVLSGFILAHVYLGDGENVSFDRRKFWMARVARIYPVYLIGLLLAAPFVFEAHFNPDRPAWSTLKLLVTGGSCCTLTQSWIPPMAMVWNSPGWSLSAEAFFYLLFPFVAPLLWRLNKRQTIVALAGLWLLCLAAPVLCWLAPISGFSDCPATVAPTSTWVTKLIAYNPLLRLPEFLLGIALCRLFVLQKRVLGPLPKIEQEKTEETENGSRFLPLFSLFSPVPLVFVVLIGIITMLACGNRILYPFLHNGLLDILFAMLIFGLAWEGAARSCWRNSKWFLRISNSGLRVLSWPIFVLLGEASYAIYILHVPLRTWMYRVLEWSHPDIHPSVPLFAAYTVMTLGISILVFKVIEEPARRMIRRRLEGRLTA